MLETESLGVQGLAGTDGETVLHEFYPLKKTYVGADKKKSFA